MSPWAKLAIAILTEVCATIALRQSDGLTKPVWVAVMVVGYVASFYVLSQITSQLEIGTIYAVWSGVGTAVVAALGVWLFGENVSALRVGGLALIILGVIALNLDGGGEHKATSASTGTPQRAD